MASGNTSDKAKTLQRQQEILDLVADFCAKHLNEEYGVLAEGMLKKLGRKRQVPFLTGKPATWAAGIIHALAMHNFLFDKSVTPHITSSDLTTFFGLGQSTISGKSKEIRDMFKMSPFSFEFTAPSQRGSNPLLNMVMVDGMMVPIEMLPEPYRQMAIEARDRGETLTFATR